MAVQILKATSAATVVAVACPEALELAAALGADHVSHPMTPPPRHQGHHGTRGRISPSTASASTRPSPWPPRVSRSLAHVTVVGLGGGTFGFSFFSLPYEASLATTYWGTLPS